MLPFKFYLKKKWGGKKKKAYFSVKCVCWAKHSQLLQSQKKKRGKKKTGSDKQPEILNITSHSCRATWKCFLCPRFVWKGQRASVNSGGMTKCSFGASSVSDSTLTTWEQPEQRVHTPIIEHPQELHGGRWVGLICGTRYQVGCVID